MPLHILVLPILLLVYVGVSTILTEKYFSIFVDYRKGRKTALGILYLFLFFTTFLNFSIPLHIYMTIYFVLFFITIHIIYLGKYLLKVLLISYYIVFIAIYNYISIMLTKFVTIDDFMKNRLAIFSIAFFLIIFLAAIYFLFIKNRKRYNIELSNREYLFMMVTPLVSVIALVYSESVLITLIFFTINLTAIISYFTILKVKNDELLNSYLTLENERYSDYISSVENSMYLNHDIKNILTTITYMVEQNDQEGALENINKIFTTSNNQYIAYSNIVPIDAILNDKIQLINSHNIEFETDIKVPYDLKFERGIELAIVLGNLFDNAIEAVVNEDNKQINFNLKYEKEKLIIVIANSCSDYSTDVDKVLITSSKKAGRYGLGIKSIKKHVESLNGYYNFDYSDEMFEAVISIPINEE